MKIGENILLSRRSQMQKAMDNDSACIEYSEKLEVGVQWYQWLRGKEQRVTFPRYGIFFFDVIKLLEIR